MGALLLSVMLPGAPSRLHLKAREEHKLSTFVTATRGSDCWKSLATQQQPPVVLARVLRVRDILREFRWSKSWGLAMSEESVDEGVRVGMS
jgi:hypothetical protein